MSLDNAREALTEYLALISPKSTAECERSEIRNGGDDEATVPRGGGAMHQDGSRGAIDFDESLKAVLKLYGRAVGVLRDKRERELLTEALCDLGDLHVRTWDIPVIHTVLLYLRFTQLRYSYQYIATVPPWAAH